MSTYTTNRHFGRSGVDGQMMIICETPCTREAYYAGEGDRLFPSVSVVCETPASLRNTSWRARVPWEEMASSRAIYHGISGKRGGRSPDCGTKMKNDASCSAAM